MIREERNALILLGVFGLAAGLLYFLILKPALSDASLPRTTKASTRDRDRDRRGEQDLLSTRPKEARRMVTLDAVARDARSGQVPAGITVVTFGVDDIAEPIATVLPDGRLLVEYLPPAVLFSIQIGADGYRSRTYRNLRGEAKGVVDLGLVKMEPQRVLSGMVRDATGEPVIGAEVRIHVHRESPLQRSALVSSAAVAATLAMPALASSATNDNGQFGFAALPATPHLIVIEHPDHPTMAHAVRGLDGSDVQVTIRIPTGTGVEGLARIGRSTHPPEHPILLIADAGPFADEMPIAIVTPDEKGHFTAPRLGGSSWFAFSLAPGAAAVGIGPYSSDGSPLRIAFPEGAPVTGRITRRNGGAIAGARIKASSPNPGSFTRSAESDAAGQFQLDGIPYGVCTLEVAADGFSAARRVVPVASFGADVSVELLPPTTLSGEVLTEATPVTTAADSPATDSTDTERTPTDVLHTPLVGALVSAGSISTVSDVRGQYRLDGLPLGTVEVKYQARGFEPVIQSLEIATNRENRHEQVLLPGGVVRALVKEPSGRPRGGAQILVIEETPDGPVTRGVGRSDSNGKHRFEGLKQGTYRILAAAPGTAPVLSSPWILSAGTKVPGFEITLATQAAVEGEITDVEDKPVVGAVVEVIADADDPWQRLSLSFTQRTGISDEHGHFRIGGLPAGNIRIIARTDGDRAGMTEAAAVLRAGEVTAGEWIKVSPRTRIEGTIVEVLNAVNTSRGKYSDMGGDEQPAAFAEVILIGLDASDQPIASERIASTDATGRFHFRAPPFPKTRMVAHRRMSTVILDEAGEMSGQSDNVVGVGFLKIQLLTP